MENYKINPALNSSLMTVLFNLEPLRYDLMRGTTPPWLFYDLKEILHIIESLSSARIEGNHTTLVDAATKIINNKRPAKASDESLLEILNIKKAIDFAENSISQGQNITLSHIRNLHKIITSGLKEDTSETPGAFRTKEVIISGSNVVTSSPAFIQADMQDLVDYINKADDSKMDVIKIACAHHRFVAIHPFDNGNGRTARLLTYMMLIKYGFLRNGKAILNPSSIFCMNRNEYYSKLMGADTLVPEKIEEWCCYVASGILSEAKRVKQLLDKDFASKKLILPALHSAKNNKLISEIEFVILKTAVEMDLIQASDVKYLFGTSASDSTKCSRFLAKMVNKGLLMHPPKYPKKYVIRFYSKELLPSVLRSMDLNGFLSDSEKGEIKF